MHLNGLHCHVERIGNGPPLLLLHGFTGSTDEWAALLPALAPLREVVAVDLIGHGRSAAPRDPTRYSFAHCVTDLVALLDALGLARTDVLGYSLGGRVALHLAAAAPERVGALLLESSSPGIADPAERAARAASDDALADRIEREGLAWFVEHWASIPLFASQQALPVVERAALRERRLRGSAVGYANSLRGMGAGRQTNLWERLPTLHAPALLVSGALDLKYVAILTQMAERMAGARHISVPGAGHTVHLEQREAFAQLVVGYLKAGF